MIFKAKKKIGLHIGNGGIRGVEVSLNGRLKITRELKKDHAVEFKLPSIKELLSSAIEEWDLGSCTVSISIPDSIVRIAILDFEELPKRKSELTQIVLARSAKTHGIDASQFVMDFQVLPSKNSQQILSVMINRDIVTAIEEMSSQAGCAVNNIVPESFNLMNLLHTDIQDGAIVINSSDYVICAIFVSGVLDFYRCKPVEHDSQRVNAVASSFAFYSGKNPGISLKNAYVYSNNSNKSIESSINSALPNARLISAQANIAERIGVGVQGIEALAALGACLD